MYHTCGSVRPLIPLFIDLGVDILNPIQISARDMDPLKLKQDFGESLCFHGGMDVQTVLVRGTPVENILTLYSAATDALLHRFR